MQAPLGTYPRGPVTLAAPLQIWCVTRTSRASTPSVRPLITTANARYIARYIEAEIAMNKVININEYGIFEILDDRLSGLQISGGGPGPVPDNPFCEINSPCSGIPQVNPICGSNAPCSNASCVDIDGLCFSDAACVGDYGCPTNPGCWRP